MDILRTRILVHGRLAGTAVLLFCSTNSTPFLHVCHCSAGVAYAGRPVPQQRQGFRFGHQPCRDLSACTACLLLHPWKHAGFCIMSTASLQLCVQDSVT